MAEFWLGDSNGPMGDVGAFMDSELRVDRADLAAHIRQLDGARNLIAIVGAPGSGKSHLAEELAAQLNAHTPGSAAVVGMDGFHRSNAELEELGQLARKGAPETFDVAGLNDLLTTLRAARADVTVPTFDCELDEPNPHGGLVPAATRYVLIEGNYLLLTRPEWRDLFPLYDLSIRLEVPEDELRARLARRWQDLPAEEARCKIEENDLPNGRLIRRENRAADFVVFGA
ncbi:nucleoside/nucleotide kinase family protein [Sedimentimonas flavescens]|uniref:Nucleoside/nucleotide kinase family protein n=1 Tax=Sedimentimonas flavescens TaxID=2851012 RepID=A0ABT2ZXZ5_9RHOB|nr:AAA family ATPase [Sedimentimonas flavescens]MCV2878614.1 nucleoside/nucleotide kinase family protein [Sedimentimonas flavescens]